MGVRIEPVILSRGTLDSLYTSRAYSLLGRMWLLIHVAIHLEEVRSGT